LFRCNKYIATLVVMKKYFAAAPMPYIRPLLLYAFLSRGVYCLYSRLTCYPLLSRNVNCRGTTRHVLTRLQSALMLTAEFSKTYYTR
jgi:hypothetical protein